MRAALLVLLLAAAPQDGKKGPKNAEVRKAYAALMKEAGRENEGLKADLDARKDDAAVKARLAKIRKAVEAASKLDYLKGTDEQVADFKSMFEISLDVRLKSFQDAAWTAETSGKLYERLQASCRTCHELFRDE